MQTAMVLTAGPSKGELLRVLVTEYASEIGRALNFLFTQGYEVRGFQGLRVNAGAEKILGKLTTEGYSGSGCVKSFLAIILP